MLDQYETSPSEMKPVHNCCDICAKLCMCGDQHSAVPECIRSLYQKLEDKNISPFGLTDYGKNILRQKFVVICSKYVFEEASFVSQSI